MLGETTSLGEFGQGLLELGVGLGVIKITRMVRKFRGKVFPIGGGDGAEARKLIEACFHFLAEFIIGFGATSEADDGVVRREGAFVLETEEGGDEFAGGEITAGPEDDHDEGGKDPIDLGGGATGFRSRGKEGGGSDGAHGWEQW